MSEKSTAPNATVHKTVEKGGKVVEEKTEPSDEFKDLLKDDGFASVSCSYAMGVDFNAEKVSFHISVKCDQDEKTMDKAAERCFRKVVAYVASAAEELGWKKA